jgi:hypothetical protein
MPPSEVTFTRLRPAPPITQRAAPAFSAGLSQPIRLPGTQLDLRLHADVPVGTSWTLTVNSEPALDLGGLLGQLDGLGQESIVALFGLQPEEPYRTWKALWESDMPWPYRLGAVLLALARRTAELPPLRSQPFVFRVDTAYVGEITPSVVYYFTDDGIMTQGYGLAP